MSGFKLPDLRQVFPSFNSQDLIDVQPMSGPTDMVFHVTYKYGGEEKPTENCKLPKIDAITGKETSGRRSYLKDKWSKVLNYPSKNIKCILIEPQEEALKPECKVEVRDPITAFESIDPYAELVWDGDYESQLEFETLLEDLQK